MGKHIFKYKNKNEHDFLTLAIKIDFDLKEKNPERTLA